jgi:hypothetical protein
MTTQQTPTAHRWAAHQNAGLYNGLPTRAFASVVHQLNFIAAEPLRNFGPSE